MAHSGSLQLGNTHLDGSTLDDYAGQLRTWGASLSENADILLYGCNVADGEWGVAFVENLAALTGADVAASNNLTGAATLGGDWVLEASTGVIEAAGWFGAAAASYQGLLVTESGATAIAQATDLTSNQTFELVEASKTLDLTPLDKDLMVTVKSNSASGEPGKRDITVQEMNAGLGVGAVATYQIHSDSGKVHGLVLGHAGRTVKLVLEGDVNTLDLSTVAGLTQVALGDNANSGAKTLGWLNPGQQSVAIVMKGAAPLENLKVGAAGGTAAINLFIGKDQRVQQLERGGSFTGKLGLHYPQDNLASGRVTTADLALPTPVIAGIGRLSGFDKTSIAEIHTPAGEQVIKLIDTAGVIVTTGAGNDVIVGGANNQTLVGGAGSDQYVFANGWGGDTVTEVANGGTGDHLDFSAVTAGLTVSVYGSELPTGNPTAGQKGLQVQQTGVATNKVVDAAFIEKFTGGTGSNVYAFHDHWGYFSSTGSDPSATLTLNKAAAAPPGTTATLDFGAVTHDLEFKLDEAGEVTVTASVKVTPSGGTEENYTYQVNATGITSIVGGKGQNTYQVVNPDALLGHITTGAGGTNVLDYSDYSGAQAIQAIVVDQTSGLATGLRNRNTPITATKETQTVNLGDAGRGSFSLKLGALDTGPIAYSSDADTTKNAIQEVLNAWGAGLFTVTNGTANKWLIEFAVEANHPAFQLDASGLLTNAALATTGTSVSTDVEGVAPMAAGGIDSILNIVRSTGSAQMLLFNAKDATGATWAYVDAAGGTVSGSGQSDLLIGAVGNDVLTGGGNNDYIVGGGGTDSILGNAGDDILIGGLGADTIVGGAGKDVIAGGGGTDTLYGGADNDTYQLANDWGNATIFEAKGGGADILDLSGVTQNVSYVLSEGQIKAGTIAPTLSNQPTFLNGWKDVRGTFDTSSGNVSTVTTAKLGSLNEIQVLSLGPADPGKTFQLSLPSSAAGVEFAPTTISVGSNDKITRANIESALNAALSSSGGAVKVTTDGPSTFAIEFTAPKHTDLPPIVLHRGTLSWPDPELFAQGFGYTLDLGTSRAGSFGLKVTTSSSVLDATAIAVVDDNAQTALNIQNKLNALSGVTTTVSVSRPGKFFIKFDQPSSVSNFQVTSPGTLIGAGVDTKQEGRNGNEFQTLNIQGATTGTFILKIGDRETEAITYDADPVKTAANIQTAINKLPQISFIPLINNFKTIVTGSGSASDQTFVIEFEAPADKDVAEIAWDVTTLPGAVVVQTTVHDGNSSGAVETIKAANADNVFYFGNQVVNSVVDVAKQAPVARRFSRFRRFDHRHQRAHCKRARADARLQRHQSPVGVRVREQRRERIAGVATLSALRGGKVQTGFRHSGTAASEADRKPNQ